MKNRRFLSILLCIALMLGTGMTGLYAVAGSFAVTRAIGQKKITLAEAA